MTEKVRFGTVTLEFTRQLGRGDALGETSEDQDDLDNRSFGALESRFGEEVEDLFASSATVVEDWGAMAAVDAEPILVLTTRAGQSVGMKPVEESLKTGVWVHQ